MVADIPSFELALSPFCKILLRRARPRVLSLVFSPVNDAPGRFSFERTLRQAGADAVLLNIPARSYYLRGIPGLGDDLEASLVGLRRIIAETGATEVVTIGLSMGGYGAALFGALLGVDRVLSMGGETLLRLPGSRSRTFIGDRFEPSHPDIRPHLAEASRTQFHFLFGEQDLIDIYSASRVRDLPNVHVHPVRHAPHEIARWLAERQALVPLISAFVERGEIEADLDIGTVMRAGDEAVADLYEAQRAFLAGDAALSAQRAQAAAAALPDLALAQFQLGQALERIGQMEPAEAALRRAVGLSPAVTLYRVTLARTLLAQNKCAEAEALVEAALVEAPRLALAHHIHGNVLARRGDHAGAVAAQEQAIALDGTNASFPAALGQAFLAMGCADKAEEAFEKAVSLNPAQGYLHYLRGRAQVALGLIDGAVRAFEQAVALSPGNEAFRRALSELRHAA